MKEKFLQVKVVHWQFHRTCVRQSMWTICVMVSEASEVSGVIEAGTEGRGAFDSHEPTVALVLGGAGGVGGGGAVGEGGGGEAGGEVGARVQAPPLVEQQVRQRPVHLVRAHRLQPLPSPMTGTGCICEEGAGTLTLESL